VLEDFQPQWHHIFPKKFLEDKYDDIDINALANIAVIGPTIISASVLKILWSIYRNIISLLKTFSAVYR